MTPYRDLKKDILDTIDLNGGVIEPGYLLGQLFKVAQWPVLYTGTSAEVNILQLAGETLRDLGLRLDYQGAIMAYTLTDEKGSVVFVPRETVERRY